MVQPNITLYKLCPGPLYISNAESRDPSEFIVVPTHFFHVLGNSRHDSSRTRWRKHQLGPYAKGVRSRVMPRSTINGFPRSRQSFRSSSPRVARSAPLFFVVNRACSLLAGHRLLTAQDYGLDQNSSAGSQEMEVIAVSSLAIALVSTGSRVVAKQELRFAFGDSRENRAGLSLVEHCVLLFWYCVLKNVYLYCERLYRG